MIDIIVMFIALFGLWWLSFVGVPDYFKDKARVKKILDEMRNGK